MIPKQEMDKIIILRAEEQFSYSYILKSIDLLQWYANALDACRYALESYQSVDDELARFTDGFNATNATIAKNSIAREALQSTNPETEV